MRGETVGIIPASDGGSPGGLSGLSLALGGNKTLSDLMWPVLGLSMTNLTVVVVSACSPSELWNADQRPVQPLQQKRNFIFIPFVLVQTADDVVREESRGQRGRECEAMSVGIIL